MFANPELTLIPDSAVGGGVYPPDTFQFDLEDVGEPYKLRVELEKGGLLSGTSSWHLEKVVIINKATSVRYEFECDKWLSTDRSKDGGLMSRELPLSSHLGADAQSGHVKERAISRVLEAKTYVITVTTGDIKGAGTDANVFATVFGEHGDTGERKLAKSSTHRDKFERGHDDVFEIEALDLGDLERLRIRHDNWGLGADW